MRECIDDHGEMLRVYLPIGMARDNPSAHGLRRENCAHEKDGEDSPRYPL